MQTRQFPWEYQMDAKDCGPACIKMIAKYYGKYYSLQYLRDLCGITREGVSFLDISYAAEKIGLRTVAVKATMENLTNRIPLPCIIHWDQHHFVVVYKTKKGKIYVSDPAKGLLSYPEEDFKDRWYKEGEEFGMLMVLEPMANFKQIEAHERIERFKSFENLLNYFTPYKKAFGILFAIMLIATGLQAVLPFISKSVIDIGIYTQDISFIYMMLIGNIVLLLSITLSNVLRDWVLLHVSTRVNISLISDYLIKLMKLPVTFFENKLVGDIQKRHIKIGGFDEIRRRPAILGQRAAVPGAGQRHLDQPRDQVLILHDQYVVHPRFLPVWGYCNPVLLQGCVLTAIILHFFILFSTRVVV